MTDRRATSLLADDWIARSAGRASIRARAQQLRAPAHAQRRHDLHERRRPRRHAREPHPVELLRRGLRAAGRRVGDQPAQPRLGVQLRRRPPERVRAGEDAAAHADSRRSRSATAARGSCSGARAVTARPRRTCSCSTRMLVDGDDPQAAITAPRFTIDPETGRVAIEDHFDPAWIDDLRAPRPRDRRRAGAPPRPRHRARDRMPRRRLPRRLRSREPRAASPACEPHRPASPVLWRRAGSARVRILTIPNVISVVRLACVPAVPLAAVGRRQRARRAGLLAAGLGATDWVDGYIARHFDQGSELGKILDPTADRVLLVAAAIAVLTQGLPGRGQRRGVDHARPRGPRSPRPPSRSALAGRPPHRRRVGGQGGHARADVLAADVPRRRRDDRRVARVLRRRARGDSRSAASASATTPPPSTYPPRAPRCAKAERLEPEWRLAHEGSDPGRR